MRESVPNHPLGASTPQKERERTYGSVDDLFYIDVGGEEKKEKEA